MSTSRSVTDDGVLVRIRAASMNPYDWHFMRGEADSFTRAMFGCVQAEGPSPRRRSGRARSRRSAKDVTRFRLGDEVFGEGVGAFAEYVCVPERSLAKKPANLTFEQAAAVPMAAVTALQGLRDGGKIQAGQKVLVNGASGGVGTFAVQIAKALGAEVTGVCSTKNVEMVRSIGADHVIDYTREDFTRSGERYDLILDIVGSPFPRRVPARAHLRTRRSSSSEGPAVVRLAPADRLVKAVVMSRFVSQRMVPLLAHIARRTSSFSNELAEAGKLRAVIDRTYPLSDVPDAIRYVEASHARGKVIITV